MPSVIIEKRCCIEHEGRQYCAGGAMVTPDYIVAYLGDNGVITDWHGRPLGTYRISATWRTPYSYVSSTMNQVYAKVRGTWYTGRSGGVGMIFRGRRVRDGVV